MLSRLLDFYKSMENILLAYESAPESIDMAKMSEEQIHSKIQRGYNDYKAGRVQNAAGAFARFQESHSR